MATPDVVKSMRQQASPDYVSSFWSARYPNQIPERLVIAEELKGNVIQLEGRDLLVVEVGHTDTEHTTCLHVPSAGLVVGMPLTTTSIFILRSQTPKLAASGSLHWTPSNR